MKDQNYDQGKYPDDLTEQEKRLGFEPLILGAYGLPNEGLGPLQDAAVIAKQLSSSDVLVKVIFFDKISYSHKRFGTDADMPSLPPEWWPINDPVTNPLIAISNFKNGITNSPNINDIIPCAFRSSRNPNI